MKTGSVLRWQRYSPADCRANPQIYFVFGDNLAGWGRAGQACIRDEPNAIGVPTKKTPHTTENAYFTDDDWSGIAGYEIRRSFEIIETALVAGHDVAIPADGLGTGMAQLSRRAPRIYAYIEKRIRRLEKDDEGDFRDETTI